MQTQEFFGQVQHRAHLANLDEAIRATRATLETLAERIGADEAQDLGAELPEEIARYLRAAPGASGERLTSDEFLMRCSEREGVDLPVSIHHVRAVLEVLQQAVTAGEVAEVLERLPRDYRRLFGGAGGKMAS